MRKHGIFRQSIVSLTTHDKCESKGNFSLTDFDTSSQPELQVVDI